MGVHQERIVSTRAPGRTRSRHRLIIAAAALIAIALIAFAAPATATGAMQISGLGNWPVGDECAFDPAVYDFSFVLSGDLAGCVYVIVDSAEWSPSGTYRELGTEYYFIDGGGLGMAGYFETTYRFTGKFEDSDPGRQIFGRCQHPIVAGSGTEDFAGVTGRLDFKDDVEAGNFPYRGHMRR